MAFVLRAAENSPAFLHLYDRGFRKSVDTPEDLALSLINCVCLIALLPVIAALRRNFLPSTRASWFAPLISLLIIAITYVVRYEQRFTMPYDIPSLLFFTLGLLAIMRRQGVLLLLLIAIAAPNRETVVFLLPIWFWTEWKEGRRLSALIYSAAGAGIWFSWRVAIAHILDRVQPYSSGLQFKTNINTLLMPAHWPQILSVFGFLAIPMWMLRDQITDQRLRAIWQAAMPFVLSILVLGLWKETRIFGELSTLAGITFAMEVERVIEGSGDRLAASARGH
jgi:hypothetical protein